MLLGLLSLGAIGYFSTKYGKVDLSGQTESIDQFLSTYHDLNSFNGTVLVAQDGAVLLRKGYGVRNVTAGTSHDGDSIFRIYSTTKSFTSTVILQLVAEGQLALSDTVDKFYPALPHAAEITIEHLLSHTSGLYEFTRESNFENSESELLALLESKPLDFPAGSAWSYCNSGYCLLGHIIAKVTGKSYEQTVSDRIFGPLGMKHSGFGFASLENEKKAIGYQTLTREEQIPSVEYTNGPFAAGAIYSTVDDLHLFHQGLLSGTLLRKDLLERAWSGNVRNQAYGLGWQLGFRPFRRRVVSHSGGAAGFVSNFSFQPEKGLCVIVLDNHERANTSFLTDRIYDMLDGKKVSLPAEVDLPLAHLERLEGFFHVRTPESVMVRTYIEDGRLAVELDGRPEGVLLAQSKHRFLQPETNATVRFRYDGEGNCDSLEVKHRGMTMKGLKSSSPWGIPDTVESELVSMLSELSPGEEAWHEHAFRLAHLWAYEEQEDRYRDLCREMLKNVGPTESPKIAERTVKTALISHPPRELLDDATALADRAYSKVDEAGTFEWGGPVSWRSYLALAKGVADFRRDDVESAIGILESATAFSVHDVHNPIVRDLFLTMAYAQTDQRERARKLIRQTDDAIERLPAAYGDGAWHDRILVELIRREAAATLELSGDGQTP
jgi:CubicO group peptidase (beta-lactamase class C family)